MLKLCEIKKNYDSGDNIVHALKGINLEFRENEFVAILGHSGCGKTTLLNIIGGLDHYTSGDLIINGKSTKNFTDKDWDSYRNHSIGFVFQSYNLIPHQTVLSNVELALTLSGVDPSERKSRAKEALEKVGLGDQLNKKPNQLSGGQMQRVAIARALVNNPDIVLADEPTGALDTETSVQIMEILKEISKDKLIIMVTHNPELANEYASRIIKLSDGLITDDTKPYDSSAEELSVNSKNLRTSMSFFTALGLSLNNLMTKKARTILTAFAGSIGIIGIALIMSLSNGIQNYIDKVQGDTLSSYPLTIQAETLDMTSMMTSLMGANTSSDEKAHEKDAVYSNTILYDMINNLNNAEKQTNNLNAFKKYLENPESEINQYISTVQYSYDIDMNLYCKDIDGKIVKTDITEIIQTAMSQTFGGDYSSYFSTFGSYYSIADAWQEILPTETGKGINSLMQSQYDLVYGKWPDKYDEVILFVDENNEVSDLVLYALGLKSNETLGEDMQTFISQENLRSDVESWSYEDICNLTFRYIYPADMYSWDSESEEYVNMTEDELGLKDLYNKGLEIKLVGIVKPNEDAISGSMSAGSIGYLHELIEYVVENAEKKELVSKQLSDPKTDIFTSLPFLEGDESLTNSKKIQAVKDYIENGTDEQIADLYKDYMSVPEDDYLQETIDEQMDGKTRQDIEDMILDYAPEYESYIKEMDDDLLFDYVEQMLEQTITEQYGIQMRAQFDKLETKELVKDFEKLTFDDDDYLWIYNNAMPPVYSDSNYTDVLLKLGYVDLDNPSSINLYASTFENKDAIGECIERYNDKAGEDDSIEYTDIVAILMSSITTIINVISYVLIAFVAISLVVSTIMIAIITYVSVLERTKEIGILRAIGASKQDVRRVFNAETFIIGLTSGVMGILLTLLLNIPINIIVHDLTGIMSLNSELPTLGAVGLIVLSVILTTLAGLIPSGMAAKQDPVEALRTE